jgi:lipopolysaccharide export LptBFGC system permease protein LptF
MLGSELNLENVSVVGVIVSVVLTLIFFVEMIVFFCSFSRDKRSSLPLHLLGTITIGLVAFSTITATIGSSIDSKVFVYIVLILAVIFFILASIKSVTVEKPIKRKSGPKKIRKNNT